VGGLGINPAMMIVLGDGSYDTIHSVIGKIQRSSVAAVAANNYLEDSVPSFRSGMLIVTYVSKFSLPSLPTQVIGCTQRQPGGDARLRAEAALLIQACEQ